MHHVNRNRRLILKGGLAAGSLFLPVPYAYVWAQSDGTMKLLRAPKVALVLGNSKYKEAPLKNPANDAKAISEALKASGFDVTLKMDAGKADMAAAVQAYVQTLAAKKSVGLFYYAGHGIQLAWRNYMLPVDADINTIVDIQKQGVEVNSLIEGITKAANPMNLIILDACRDNPFGNLKGVDQKGLSQMDAPPSTLLAYATSPGNVASDGDGANGLYTENLLRELKVPEAKVEDIFKRVRLGVRVKSKGAQIPWESTSLEEDFWFLPPKELKKLSEAEKERAFKEELALWERIQKSSEPGPFEDYLRRYPNGNFSELAQLDLDRVLAKQGEKKILVASQEGNPFTKGSAAANTNFKVGDSYSYRVLDYFSKAERSRVTDTVVRISDDEVIFDSGLVTDLLGNNLKLRNGVRFTPNQTLPLEYAVGKRWVTRFNVISPNGQTGSVAGNVRVAGREVITVPAGTFDTFRIEIRTYADFPNLARSTNETNYWMAPDKVRLQVVREQLARRNNQPYVAERYELTSFKQS
jgi:hypothetical protein